MTDHVHGEDSYVECDRFYVVTVTPYEDFEDRFRPENDCYCGSDAVQIARVAFTNYKRPEGNREPWPDFISETLKAHRCEKHRFEK